MKESDLFNELIQIADANQREARLQEIARSDQKLAESLRKLLEHYQLDEDFLNTTALEQIANHPDATELLGGLKHFEEPKRYTAEQLANEHLEPSDQPGSIGKFAGYEVQSRISFGGTATVYKGIDPDLEKTVVIKVLHTDLASDLTAIGRLQKEARAMGRIKHSNVVEVYRISMEPIPFIAMEYVEGQSLDQFLAHKGKLDLEEFYRIAQQILLGIQAAHELGCVHRDLKPANILLTNSLPTVAKITDFGLVRHDKDSRLTRTDSVVGTPRYMSPEQIRDQATDARSDLFSLGAVFYEMLSGEPLFRGESQFAQMQSVIRSDPSPINTVRQDAPLEAATLLQKMLQKDPNHRYKSARDVLAALDSIDWQSTSRHQSLISSPRPSLSLPSKWIAALCAIAGVLILGFLMTRQPRVTKVITEVPEGPAVPLGIPSEQIPSRPIATIDHPWIQELRIPFASDVANEYQKRWADALGIAVESENQFGIRFVLIPPGEYRMGYEHDDFALAMAQTKYESEREMIRASATPTWVRISFPFYISKYEITEAERARVLGTDHSLPSTLDIEYTSGRPRGNSTEHPVTRVPWEEAVLMCQRLNEESGLDALDAQVQRGRLGLGSYRLPTEAEWEWACRAGRSGVSIVDPKELDQEVWMEGNTPVGVQLRGLKNPNPFGLHDMLGNVQEWCLDNYDEKYFSGNTPAEPILLNPLVITTHPHFKNGHILRGGSIIFDGLITNFSYKAQRDYYSSSWFTGFRIVRPIPPEAIAKLKP